MALRYCWNLCSVLLDYIFHNFLQICCQKKQQQTNPLNQTQSSVLLFTFQYAAREGDSQSTRVSHAIRELLYLALWNKAELWSYIEFTFPCQDCSTVVDVWTTLACKLTCNYSQDQWTAFVLNGIVLLSLGDVVPCTEDLLLTKNACKPYLNSP